MSVAYSLAKFCVKIVQLKGINYLQTTTYCKNNVLLKFTAMTDKWISPNNSSLWHM